MQYLTTLAMVWQILSSAGFAQALESPRLRIDSPSIDFTLPESEKKQLPLTEDEARFERLGYINKTRPTAERMQVHLSQSALDYGELDPNTFIEKKTQLTINEGPTIYSVRMLQDHDLQKVSGATIPATRCDEGRVCSSASANQWRSRSVYGLGFSLKSPDAQIDFINGTRFRSLATAGKTQSGIIMRGQQKRALVMGELIYRLNTSPAQEEGTYEHTVTFFALPGY